jgi:mycothiol synthase
VAEPSYRLPTTADAPALAAIHLARTPRDQVDPYSTSEDWYTLSQLQTALEKASQTSTLDHWLVAEMENQIVGYSTLNTWLEDDGTWVYLIRGWVLPTWRGQGAGSHMLQHLEALARTLAARDHPGEKAEFAANASSTEADTTALLLENGYRPGYTVLEMDLPTSALIPQHPLPIEVEVRPVNAEHLLALAKCVGACYQNEYDSGRYLENYNPAEYAADLAEPHQDPTLWQVAWAGDEIIAQVLSAIDGRRAEVFEVSVHPNWRRKGLGRALLGRALLELRRRAVPVIRLHTVAEFKTRAYTLYQSVGFTILKEFPRYRKPMD